MAETFTRCPYCGDVVDPEDPEAVHAAERLDLPGMGQAHDFVDGRRAVFHPGCPPERVGYARKSHPEQ